MVSTPESGVKTSSWSSGRADELTLHLREEELVTVEARDAVQGQRASKAASFSSRSRTSGASCSFMAWSRVRVRDHPLSSRRMSIEQDDASAPRWIDIGANLTTTSSSETWAR